MNSDLNRMPSMISAEKAILGALLLESNSFYEINQLIKPEMFYLEAHSTLYELIHQMHMKEMKIDMITVTHYAKQQQALEKIGGATAISNMTTHIASAAHLETHARIVLDCYIRRVISKRCILLNRDALDLHIDLEEIINSISDFVTEVTTNVFSLSKVLSYQQALVNWVEYMKNPPDQSNQLSPSIRGLRYYLHTYHPGHLIIIAGRPGMGKSAFALNECFEIAKRNIPVMYFSIEMDEIDLVTRTVTKETHIANDILKRRNLNSEQWTLIDQKLAWIEKCPLYIDYTANMDLAYIKTITKQYIRTKKIKMIAIDYLQLIKGDQKLPRERQIAILSSSLKNLAKELNIPIMLLAQLNRQTEARTKENHKPKLSDLRESGAIEQDADSVILIHRPDYYITDDPKIQGLGKLIIAKNRHGQRGDVKVSINHGSSEWVDFNN